MAKYSFEFKKKIVDEYLAGKGGSRYLAHKYNLATMSPASLGGGFHFSLSGGAYLPSETLRSKASVAV